MTVRPKYYYNIIGNICNEKEEFGTRSMHKEDLNEPFMNNIEKGSDSLLDLLNQYDEENEQLKQFIQELTTKSTAKIYLADGSVYKVDAILTDFKGDVE